ncbi:protein kinase domain-containing protein [Streptomyces sp. 8N706]|uniref:protein kinase domain-containing protein n=1 Tax=Streptomyces sp. 8N706 TaxID=3457416 RepID=UPI003FD53B9A
MQHAHHTRRFHEAELADGRYRLETRLGSGGVADVYRAFDTQLGRSVAIKAFRPSADGTDEHRFHEEARLLAGLNHPGLVTVYDFGVEAYQPFLVMELVSGRSLGELLLGGPLDLDKVATLGGQLAEVLAYVHQHGVVHRDIKPANILLDHNGQARLADFGVSELLGARRHIAEGGVSGTAAYMAPEQVQGRNAGPAADIYALGLVLLQCVTGRLEYPGDGHEAATARLSRPPYVPAELPARLRRALTAMTASDPAARPTATQCVAMLRTEEVPQRPEAEPAFQGPPERESKTLRNWALGGAAAILAVLVWTALTDGEEKPESEPAQTPTSSAPQEPGLPDLPSEKPSVDVPDLPEADEKPLDEQIKDWFDSDSSEPGDATGSGDSGQNDSGEAPKGEGKPEADEGGFLDWLTSLGEDGQ